MYIDANLLIGMKIGFLVALVTVFLIWIGVRLFVKLYSQEESQIRQWMDERGPKS